MANKSCGASRRLQTIYYDMKHRCYNSKNKAYARYAGKGITVCDEWLNNRSSFYEWAITSGYHEELRIDRIDNSKGYYPDNCRWTDTKVQTRNRTISVVDENIVMQIRSEPKGSNLKLLCDKYNLNQYTLKYIRYGFSWNDGGLKKYSMQKLSLQDVNYIRSNPDNLKQSDLARKFNVNSGHINKIIKYKKFKDVYA